MKKHGARRASKDGREIHGLFFSKSVKKRHKKNKQAKKARKVNR